MKIGKVVVISRHMEPESWGIFMGEKPDEWQVTIVNPDDGEQKIAKELEDTEYLVTTRSGPISSKVIENANKLKLIQTSGQGTNHLPVKWALDKGIYVANSGGANAIAVAEHTVLLMLACLRKLLPFNQSIREGNFRSQINRRDVHQLYNQTIGIIGFGNTGRRVAKLCHSLGAYIVYFERMFIPYATRADFKAYPVSLNELLSTSDIVTLHIPLVETNKRLIGWDELCKMKTSAYIINTSRGAIIDENALTRALTEKKIAGAGLDVWETEPPSPNNPLFKMDNVVATPHIAGEACENEKWDYETVWRNILLVSEGKEPLHRVLEF